MVPVLQSCDDDEGYSIGDFTPPLWATVQAIGAGTDVECGSVYRSLPEAVKTGMIIKNGIVLMDEITLQIGQGTEPVTALIDSAQSRLRPVMMAALTTILGMIPLLTDAMFGSLAASIMGGLLFGTVITLVFIPVLYALFFHIKHVD